MTPACFSEYAWIGIDAIVKKQILLHIGTGKTGTGSIQNFLFDNRDVLLKQYRLLYPVSGLKSVEHFGERIHAHYGVVRWALDRNKIKLEELAREIEGASADRAVISCEDFYHRLTAQDIGFLAECLGGHDSHVVCYVRRQDQYMESAWKQQIKVGDLHTPFPIFLKRHVNPDYLQEVHANYERMLNAWSEVFGPENIILRVFDRTQWRNRDLIEDFLDACRFDPGSGARTLRRREMTNVALPSELARLLCRINATKSVARGDQQRLVAYLRSLREYNNPPLLTLEDRQAILRNYRECNEAMFRRWTGKGTPPCFTDAALPKDGGGKKLAGASLEDIALKCLIAAWGKAADSEQRLEEAPTVERLRRTARSAASGIRRLVVGTLHGRQGVPEEIGRPWPPAVLSPLGFEPTQKPADVVRMIKQHQAEGRPMSVIRLGDGESAVIGYPEFTPPNEFERFLRVFFGANALTKEQKTKFVQLVRDAVRAADIIGVTGGSEVTKFTVIRYFLEHYRLTDVTTAITHLALHRSLQEFGLYDELLRNQDVVGLITCRDVEQSLKSNFSIREVVTYKVPEEVAHARDKSNVARHFPDRFEAIRETLAVPKQGMLFLIGAGPLGKVYCQWVKERGGIGLDVGSMFDAWAGLATRRYMRTDAGNLDARYQLKG